MFGLGKLKNKFSKKVAISKAKKTNVTVSQERILRAIGKLGPCNYREISSYLHCIDGSVTPRIPALKAKELIKVAYVKVAYKGKRRTKHYAITGRGSKYLLELDNE